jgi:hypothetical protein
VIEIEGRYNWNSQCLISFDYLIELTLLNPRLHGLM